MKNLKNKFILASAILALASCADNSYLGENEENPQGGTGGAISFEMSTPSLTRAEGVYAATALGNQFIVWGVKNEGSTNTAKPYAIVFKNYQVNYVTSSANSSTSNTKGWEYVGYTHSTNYQSNIKTKTSVSEENALSGAQTIKYWDYNAESYTFTAVSALSSDIENGKVIITKKTDGDDLYLRGYTVNVKSDASYDKIYFADRLPVTNTPTANYGKEVKLQFRNFATKVRFGIYETIPGYKVKITGIYYGTNTTTAVTDKFGIDGNFIKAGDNTSFTVTYESSGTNLNKAKTAINTGAATDSYFETAPSSGTVAVPFMSATEIGTDATNATFNKSVTENAQTDNKAYTAILPNPSNNTNLTLKIEYQLISEDTGETINVSAKEVQVPAAYCKWLSNYAYSYLFKITDKELTPITFDAVTITDETGYQETITTVPEGETKISITTIGVKNNKYSYEKNEYETGTDIYAAFMNGATPLTPAIPATHTENVQNKVNVYSVDYKSNATDQEKAEKPITEASVANAIEHTGGIIEATDITTSTDGTYFTNLQKPSVVSTVPAEDGTSTKTIDAVKLPGVVKTGKYAVEIITYEKITPAPTGSVNGYYTTDNTTFTAASGDAVASTDYYKQTKTYKVITIVAPTVTP